MQLLNSSYSYYIGSISSYALINACHFADCVILKPWISAVAAAFVRASFFIHCELCIVNSSSLCACVSLKRFTALPLKLITINFFLLDPLAALTSPVFIILCESPKLCTPVFFFLSWYRLSLLSYIWVLTSAWKT